MCQTLTRSGNINKKNKDSPWGEEGDNIKGNQEERNRKRVK